jgi:cobalt-precorrin 5A hydrolase/cobalt-precorrin 5A hydrolase/precorrin-3B C17-methyltransferase
MSAYVVGAGCSLGCPPEELDGLVEQVLAAGGVSAGAVRALATIDARAGEPALVATARRRGWPLRTHAPAALAAVAVPTPSPVVAEHVGTPSVAEAAALLTAGGGRIVVAKRRSAHATCALAEVAP